MDDEGWPLIRGQRLALRVLRPVDAAAWRAGEDPEQRRWFQFLEPASQERVSQAIDRWRRSWQSGGPVHHWGIWVRDGVDLAGGVEVRDRGDGRANLSYVVFPAFRRQGLASEAATLTTRWALENLAIDAVVTIFDERNEGSRGVAVAAGFEPDGPAGPWEHSEKGPMLRYTRRRGDSL